MRKRAVFLAIVAILAVALGSLVVFHRPFLVAFHHHGMLAAWELANEVGPQSPDQGHFIERSEAHRDALVAIGYFERREFRLRHVSIRTPQYRGLLDALRRRTDEPIFEITYEDPVIITIWATPEDMADWEAIIRSHDLDPGED